MEQFKPVLEYSSWYVLLCIGAGALYAWLLYSARSPWGTKLNRVLTAFRFVLVTLLCGLLLNPLLRHITTITEKPAIVIAIDNSESVSLGTKKEELNTVLQTLEQAAQKLRADGVEVDIQTFSGSPANPLETKFTAPSTDLSGLLSDVQNNYEDRNLGGVVLLSDGIYNQGVSPAFRNYSFPVYTLGAGDTIPRTDIELRAVHYNRIAYLGNKFPVKAEIRQHGYDGKITAVAISLNGKLLESKIVKLKPGAAVTEVEFMPDAKIIGAQHFLVEIKKLDGEFTDRNNFRHIYIDVINGKEKILLLAAAPHPDLKAIKSAVEQEQNYELTTCINGVQAPKDEKYDLVILHQIPDQNNLTAAIAEKYLNGKTPVWFLAGSQSALTRLSAVNNVMRINMRSNQADKVTASWNEGFGRFAYEADRQNILRRLPPLNVPFGDYTLVPGAEVLLHQQVGSVNSGKPLLAINTSDGKKQAVLAGEGIWEWRLQEYQENGNHNATDELVRKLVQFLTAKDDKRKFRVYPSSDDISETERVVFETEVYNDIYEKVYNTKIDLKVTGEDKKPRNFSFVNSEANSRFEVGSLPHGVYKYVASAQVNNRAEKAEGEFIVRELQQEAMNTTADHALLREMASRSGGKFYTVQNAGQLAVDLAANRPKDVVRSFEEVQGIVNIKWLFFAFLLLVTLEWLLRKLNGGY